MSKASQQQSHSYYVDDIPIVITDKWRLPPLPNIPEELVRPFFRHSDESVEGSQCYDFTLEQKVLDKIDEWKVVREREVQEREERLRARQEEKQRRIEAEESRLKERLTKVSYPSPDEFSSSSDEEEAHPTEDDKVYQGTFFDSILKPTVIQSRPCSATDLQQRAKKSQAGSLWAGPGQDKANKIELADFENDATDPFYNVELKTIDDLDVLAQVLQSSNMLHSKDEKGKIDQIKSEIQHKEQQQQLSNGFVQSAVIPDNVYGTGYAPNYSNYVSTASSYVTPTNGGFGSGAFRPYNQQQHQSSPLTTTTYGNDYAPDYRSTATTYAAYEYQQNYQQMQQDYQSNFTASNLVESKLRSKSVPDIVQELENEVKDSERRRIRNNSQSTETARNTAHNAHRSMTENNNCDDLLKKLPLELQALIKNISQMGFPLDRVFRVAEQFQGDDKKVSCNSSSNSQH